MTRSPPGLLERIRQFFTDEGAAKDSGPVHRVLGRDAARAFDVLTRDHPLESPDRGAVRRAWDHGRRLFLGLSSKLSPSRRLLFVAAIVAALIGLTKNDVVVNTHEVRIVAAPLLLVLSIAGLVLLLILELADRVVVRDELEVARQLQAELLPKHPPILTGYDFAFSCRTANTIGGDYYQFVHLPDGNLLIAAGDASGHGIAAGILMAVANASLQQAADRDPAPSAVMEMVNGALYRTGGPRAFMTLFCAVLQPASGHLEYVCAGHPFPLLRRCDGTLVELGSGSLPTGIRATLTPSAGATTLAEGDTLVMYSDGVPERMNTTEQAFGFDRLQALVATGGSARQVHDRIVRDLDSFAAGEPPHDDRSLVVVTRLVADSD